MICTYGYNSLSRKIGESSQIGLLPVRVASFNFDESLSNAGNLDPTSMNFPDGAKEEYRYDDINRLNQLNDSVLVPIITYDYIGRTTRVLQLTFQNGSIRTVDYDGIRRLTRLQTVIGLSIWFGMGVGLCISIFDNKIPVEKLLMQSFFTKRDSFSFFDGCRFSMLLSQDFAFISVYPSKETNLIV